MGLYPTNNAETNKFILEDCKANFLIVDDEKVLKAIYSSWDQLPCLKKIIKWGEPVVQSEYSSAVLNWEDLMKVGKEDTDDGPVLDRQKNMAINQCCILIYTSGTTGNPKGNRCQLIFYY